MISPTQMRAARAMLNLSQGEVAKSIGIAANTLSNIESGSSDAPSSRLKEIQDFYEMQGVEFTDANGIREMQTRLQRYQGAEGFRVFMDDVYETAKQYGGDICLFNSKPSMWHRWLGPEWYDMHAKRMAGLGDKIRVRITVQEGDDYFVLGSAEHRWFSKDMWKGKIFYAYGPKLGFLDFGNNDVNIMVLNQKDFADSFRVLFDTAWEYVATPPKAGEIT